jgi:hypothetical protein
VAKNDQNLNETTVEFVLRSSIDYTITRQSTILTKISTTVSLKLDNIVIMTINTTNDDISFATLNDEDYYSLTPLTLRSSRRYHYLKRPPDRRSSDVNVSWYVCGNVNTNHYLITLPPLVASWYFYFYFMSILLFETTSHNTATRGGRGVSNKSCCWSK